MNSFYLKGFTILEALISLIIMGIIITLSYSVYNLIERQMTLFQDENMSVLQYSLFNTAIKNDIYNAVDFKQTNNQLKLKYYSGSVTNYEIRKHLILRHHDIKTDTFKLKVINYEFSNLKQDVSRSSDQVFHISFEVLEDKIEANYYLRKNIAEAINNVYFKALITEDLDGDLEDDYTSVLYK